MFGFLKKKSRKSDADQGNSPLPEQQAEDVAEQSAVETADVSKTQTVEVDESSSDQSSPQASEWAAGGRVDDSHPETTPQAEAATARQAEVAPPHETEVTPEPPVLQSAPEPVPESPAEHSQPRKLSWSERLKAGLSRTRGGLVDFFGFSKIDEDFLDDLETTLLTADCGVEATQYLMEDVRRRWARDSLQTTDQLKDALATSLRKMLQPLEQPLDVSSHSPFIIMIAGVNGSGKTTSIGKLAKRFQNEGKSVLLAAGDTFRAAAREQLQIWGERNNITVIAQQGGDSAAVIFDAVNAAKSRNIDVVLADTAGRLPTQLHLMEEIAKVKRVITKANPEAPHEVMLVLDANVGQNALAQVKAFDEAIGVTGLVLTKLDGTAKGGVVAALARQHPKPLRFIGVGESIDDLQPFHVDEFVDALFARTAEKGAA